MSETRIDAAPPGGIDYIAVEESPRFVELKRRQRSFVFPLAIAFIVWYFTFVLLASFAPAFMATPVWGNIIRRTSGCRARRRAAQRRRRA